VLDGQPVRRRSAARSSPTRSGRECCRASPGRCCSKCAAEQGIEVDERPLREDEVVRAQELFITSTTREISWVARWNDKYIGQAKCGPVTLKLHQALREKVRRETQGENPSGSSAHRGGGM
jgi:hypothetical protein